MTDEVGDEVGAEVGVIDEGKAGVTTGIRKRAHDDDSRKAEIEAENPPNGGSTDLTNAKTSDET